jgi:hypothetical protein
MGHTALSSTGNVQTSHTVFWRLDSRRRSTAAQDVMIFVLNFWFYAWIYREIDRQSESKILVAEMWLLKRMLRVSYKEQDR